MRKGNRTGSATLGLAFFVVSLAIVPVSLKSWGSGTAFSPTLTAVIDVWREISGLIGDGYPTPGTTPVEQTTPAGNHDCANSALAEANTVEPQPGCDGGNVGQQPAESLEFSKIDPKTEVQIARGGPVAAARVPERASEHKRAVTAPRSTVASATNREDQKTDRSEVKVAKAIKLEVPSEEWRRSLSREVERHAADLAGLTRSLGLPSGGRLLIKVDPAPAVPAPPSRRCGSSKTTSEQLFEYRFQLRGAREFENHVLRLIGTGKKAAAERVKRSA